jgi:carboxymethylenebutenolidase
MTDSQALPINTATVQIPNGDLQIDAYLAQPDRPLPRPAIIVIQEIFGVNSHIRDVTERFARLGYVAIAPAIYQRLAPGFETGYQAEDVKLGRQYKEQTRVDELLSDLRATVAYLQAQPTVQPNAIGCIGFCFGGLVTYLAATLPEIRAAASFYGAGIPTWSPGGGPATLSYTPDIKAKLYLFFGLEDASIPPEHIAQIEAALQTHAVDYQIFRYPGADHGFFCDQRASYNPRAAADAWQQVQMLFDQL